MTYFECETNTLSGSLLRVDQSKSTLTLGGMTAHANAETATPHSWTNFSEIFILNQVKWRLSIHRIELTG